MTKYKFATTPRKYQVKALRAIIKRDGVCSLLMDPGLGKSKVVVDYVAMFYLKYGSADVLISPPNNAMDTWVEQFQTHLGTADDGSPINTEIIVLNDGTIEEKAESIKALKDVPNEDRLRIVVVNHDAFKYRHAATGKNGKKLSSVTVRDRMLDAVESWGPDIAVLDEEHRVKTHSSNVSTSFHKIAQHTHRRIGLTGTVAPNSPLDFYGVWRFQNPSRLDKRWTDFKYKYAVWGGFEGRQVLGYINLDELKRLVAKDSFVARKEGNLDLPPVTDIKVPVILSKEERAYYKRMGKELIVELPSGQQSISANTLTKMLRLRQITGGVVGYKEIVTKNGKVKEVARTEDIGSSKLDELANKVMQINSGGHKQVIFAHFRRDVARIIERMEKEVEKLETKVPIYSITGSTSNSDRVRQRKLFQRHEGPAIFVAQMRTVSLAINEFVVASYGHFYSLSQLRDDFTQARDRLDRQGQTQPVTFYYYVVPHSIDEVILAAHQEKARLEGVVTKRGREILTLGEEK